MWDQAALTKPISPEDKDRQPRALAGFLSVVRAWSANSVTLNFLFLFFEFFVILAGFKVAVAENDPEFLAFLSSPL